MNIKSIIKSNQLLNPYFTAIILAILTICLLPTATHAAANTVNILIKGEPVQFTDQTGRPFIDSNARTLVPMRIVMEKYGCTVDWEQESLSAIVKKGDVTVKVPTMQKFIMVNNVRQDTDTQPQNINGRIYLPVAAVLKAVGADVQWNDESRSVVIDGNANNSVGMVKPEGYDEFMKDFEVVKTYQYEIRPKDLQITIRNKKLDSQELENFFLSIPEEKLKLYLSYFVLAKPQYLQYKNFCLVFYSNIVQKDETRGVKGNLVGARILVTDIYCENMEAKDIFIRYQDWKQSINEK